jgi:hypothetical protein
VIGMGIHLHDDRLFDCYVAERIGEPCDPVSSDHLADCEPCAARYEELTQFMDMLRTEADAELDDVYSADHLRAQQQQIAHRIEHVGRSARVLNFPAHQVPRHSPTPGLRMAPRWVATAAVAGLLVGVGVGVFFDTGGRTVTPTPALVSVSRPVRLDPPAGGSLPSIDREDVFLSEIEVAVDRPRTAELAAFDELTPHIREISLSTRVR